MDGSVDNLMDNPRQTQLTRGRVAHRLPHRPPTAYPPRLVFDTTTILVGTKMVLTTGVRLNQKADNLFATKPDKSICC